LKVKTASSPSSVTLIVDAITPPSPVRGSVFVSVRRCGSSQRNIELPEALDDAPSSEIGYWVR